MDTIVNTEQHRAWNGYEGVHWAANQDRWDSINSGYNEALFAAAAIAETDWVLDIGCGNGQTTRLAAQHAARGRAVGLDLSTPMLERARSTSAEHGISNIEFQQGDAQVYRLPSAVFDAVISRAGVMFFTDATAAFTNIGTAVKPGGRLAILTLADDPDDSIAVVLTALRQFLPVQFLTHGAPADRLAHPDDIERVLTAAGFTGITSAKVRSSGVWGHDADDAARFLFDWGPVRHRLERVDGAAEHDARRAVTETLRLYQGNDGVRLRVSAWLTTAVRP